MNKISTSAMLDGEIPFTQADIDAGRLVPRRRAADGSLLPLKERVTLNLDAAVVERFKRLAGEEGYETLINETLKTSLTQADVEAMLRKVIREELREGR